MDGDGYGDHFAAVSVVVAFVVALVSDGVDGGGGVDIGGAQPAGSVGDGRRATGVHRRPSAGRVDRRRCAPTRPPGGDDGNSDDGPVDLGATPTPTTTAATTTTDGDVVGDVTVQEQSVDVGGRPTRNAHRRPRCSFLEEKKTNKNLKEPLDFKPINCFYIKLNFIITVLAV